MGQFGVGGVEKSSCIYAGVNNAEIDANYPVRVCFKLSFYNETKPRLDFNVPFWNDINSSIPSAAVILYC